MGGLPIIIGSNFLMNKHVVKCQTPTSLSILKNGKTVNVPLLPYQPLTANHTFEVPPRSEMILTGSHPSISMGELYFMQDENYSPDLDTLAAAQLMMTECTHSEEILEAGKL